jgi:hypothetical protein
MSLPRSPTLVAVAENPTRKFCVGIRFSPANAMYDRHQSARHTQRQNIAPADIKRIVLHKHGRDSQ